MGGDEGGWALDQDLATTRAALEQLSDRIVLARLEDSDVVHSVWEEPLLRVPREKLAGRRVVCHVCNDLVRTFENGFMLRARETLGLWVAISRCGEQDLRSLGLPHAYIPYAIDTAVYRRDVDSAKLEEFRARWQIPKDRYIIGNFMRDSLGSDLGQTKSQKAPEMFLAILTALHREGLPVHVLLAGPRRHWLRRRLVERGIPHSYVGTVMDGDDYKVNVLDQPIMALLYHLMDLSITTSRWEGGPRAVLEAAASGCKAISTEVGLSPDVLEPDCIFRSVDEAIQLVKRDIRDGVLNTTVEPQFNRVTAEFTATANVPRFRALYERIQDVEPLRLEGVVGAGPAVVPRPAGLSGVMRQAWSRISGRQRRGPRIGLWHEFHKPPYGGGNQFMMALKGALERMNVSVVSNRASSSVDVHFCNSAWFDVKKLEPLARRSKLRILHRVDGPIAIYRGSSWDEDNKIYALNNRFASATVYQSGWCCRKMLELNFKPVRPLIIKNGVDNRIFHRNGRVAYSPDRKIRLISTAWSSNPKKGGPFYKALEDRLDWSRFEYTFVGQSLQTFTRIKHIPPQDSEHLAEILRQHDVYVMASQSEACSNALIEALACGLPAVYLENGGNGEVTGLGGLPFNDMEEALSAIDRVAANYEAFQESIWVESIESIARRYLEVAERLMEL